MMSENQEEQLKQLLEKVDRILSILEKPSESSPMRAKKSSVRGQKAEPLSADEVEKHQAAFENLFESWSAGEELLVEKKLDAMDADEIRRFADANNLNVTSKTPKQKVMQLIAGRFRERRQLLRTHFNRQPPTQ